MNRFYNRLIGLILVLALAVSSVCIAVAAETVESSSDEGLLEAMEVLRLFSIIPDYYDYSVDETENVPRGDFVSGVAKMVGLTEYSGDAYYYDVPENHWAFNEISALTKSGILNGVGNKLFRPDDIITKNEGYKIVMTVLGYGDWAQYNGGYPAGYASAANRAKVSDGVSSNENVTVADMIRIFYNAIKASVLEPISYGGESVSYTDDGRETLLSLYKSIYYTEGCMTGANRLALDGTSLEAGEVMVDNVVYESDSDISDYLGERIKLFYHLDKTSEKKTILWAKPLDKKECLYITADNDASFGKESYELKYMQDDKIRTVSLSRGMVLIYNGSIVKDNISEILNMPKYTAKLVKDDSGSYSTVIVKAYENYVVGSIDTMEKVIYDKANGNRTLCLDENNYERMSLSVLGKTPLTFEEIKADNVLSVYMSKDKKYIEVHVSVDMASGVIDSVRNTDGGRIIQIDAIEYFEPDTAKGDEVKAGQSVKLYLDSNGDIAFVVSDASSYTPVYLIAAVESDSVFAPTLKFRALTKQSGVREIECADSVKIDGKVYKDSKKAVEYMMPGGEFKPQFAMVRIDSNGKIKMIDTVTDNPDTTDDDVLRVSVPLQDSAIYRNRALGHKAVLNTTSVIFSLPDNFKTAEDKDFAVVSALMDWKSYSNVETYKIQDRVGYEQFVVVQGHNASMYWESDVPVLVKSFSEVMGDDDQIYEGITAFQGSAEKKFTLTEGLSLRDRGVEEGDIIRLKTNPDGTVDDYTMIYDYDKGAENVSIGGFASQIAFSVGYITDVVDDVVKIGKIPGDTDISIYTTGVPCVIYDKDAPNDKKIYTGSVASAKTFYNEGEDCSMVVLTQSYAAPRMFVIYK